MSWMWVAIGGALGSIARYGVSRLWPAVPGGFPVPTFTVNLIGQLRHRTLIYMGRGRGGIGADTRVFSG